MSSKTIQSTGEWTQELLIEAGRLYHMKYGEVPTMAHFYPNNARKSSRLDGEALVQRFEEDACWPSSATIIKHFKSFGAYQRACGFEPTRSSADASGKIQRLLELQKQMGA
jgi:hypothetical protein